MSDEELYVPESGLGLNMSNLDETTQEELDAYLQTRWTRRGPLYDLSVNSLMADYNPKFLKLHRWAIELNRLLPSERGELTGDEVAEADLRNEAAWTVPQLYSYMALGWETGIRNEFKVLSGLGFTRAHIMEIVMFGRLASGMRGLGHVYQAIGDVLPEYRDGHGSPVFPPGWEADPEAFDSGMDLSTREFTEDDRRHLSDWYERNIGYVPKSIAFLMKYDPQFLKVHRAMWENVFTLLPKQVAPYLMLRDALLASDRDALQDAALLGKSWGISRDWIVRGVTYTTAYFTGVRAAGVAHDALDELLEHWE